MQIHPASGPDRLGFSQILLRLDELLISEPGRDRLGNIRAARSLEWLQAELDRVMELHAALRFDDPVPLEPMPDVRDALRRAAPEDSYLDAAQLFEVSEFLRTSRLLASYFSRRGAAYPRLKEATASIGVFESVEREISAAVEPDGRVKDDASEELRRVRSLISRRQVQLRETLMRELRRAIAEGWATEEQPTIRNGRMVIPIRAEAKRKLQGFVQDTSASGQTVYIEPAASLDLNNELRELQGEERREIERILRRLTGLLRAHLDPLRQNVRALATFDLLQSKARFANELQAVAPELDDGGIIEIVEGRNPILELHFRQTRSEGDGSERIVPLNLTLGADFRTLVITGPNAGGKTVAMKTVGLFALMVAHGIPIPADEKTKMPLFRALMVDIGDQQSIEEDLSTFSSHVGNLRYMLNEADEHSLCLIDEAGTGTDPDEGGALAQAVLEVLNDRGARTITTTHHGTLKAFAEETEGAENGSMEFDRSTLSPTYRFIPGVPGSSYAFEIARRTGLQTSVLARARELAGTRTAGLEELIAKFEQRNQELERRLEETRETQRKARHEQHTLEDQRRRLDRDRDEVRRQALEEARRIVTEANARVERTIREIKESQAERDATRRAREHLEDFREELVVPERSKDRKEAPPSVAPISGGIREGDQVVVDEGQTVAEVLELDGNEAIVGLGSMKMRVKLSRLTRVGGRRKQQVSVRQVGSSDSPIAAATARSRIDVRGMRADEAVSEVERLLDQALQTGQQRVEILHGKGTGALRQAIHEFLSGSPEVASFEDAPWNEGGEGVTYITLS